MQIFFRKFLRVEESIVIMGKGVLGYNNSIVSNQDQKKIADFDQSQKDPLCCFLTSLSFAALPL